MVGDAKVQNRFSEARDRQSGTPFRHRVLFEMLCLWCGKEFLSKMVGNYLHLHGA